MIWIVITVLLAVVGVAYLVGTVREIGRVRDERVHYRLSAKFWLALAGFGALMMGALVMALLSHESSSTDAGTLTGSLMALPPAVLIATGARNAWILVGAQRRRGRGLRGEGVVQGKVVDRRRRVLGQDLMALVVEAELPDVRPSTEMVYRARRPERLVRHRFVETCPGDHWAQFEPGAAVTLRYDPGNLSDYAVLLFARAE